MDSVKAFCHSIESEGVYSGRHLLRLTNPYILKDLTGYRASFRADTGARILRDVMKSPLGSRNPGYLRTNPAGPDEL